jgi:hypothetical protein
MHLVKQPNSSRLISSKAGGVLSVREPPKSTSKGFSTTPQKPCMSFCALRQAQDKLREESLTDSSSYTVEILRLKPQNDVVGQPLWGDSSSTFRAGIYPAPTQKGSCQSRGNRQTQAVLKHYWTQLLCYRANGLCFLFSG